MALYIGLMSGTSLDGVDGVLAELDDTGQRPLQALAHVHTPFPAAMAEELLSLNSPGPDELHRAARAAQAVMRTYAHVVQQLLLRAGVRAQDVHALGAHGQTVRHQPRAADGTGYSLQLANGALLAELTGIPTVCDFRSADVAAGGQGAPLVPAFHAAAFGQPGRDTALLNVGGIANLSLLGADGSVGGFDTGPGNVLMDLWCKRHFGQAYDTGGSLAASGQVLTALLATLRAEPYFDLAPPKSTGRDLFHGPWLDARLAATNTQTAAPRDVLRTLAELTARTAADALRWQMPGCSRLYVCGGGAFNTHLMQRWQQLLPQTQVQTTAELGVPADQVEAMAFAWLAACRLALKPANLPAVTGASGPRVLGALYPPPPAT